LTIETIDLYRLASPGNRVGPRALEMLEYLTAHAHKSPEFFRAATQNGDLRTRTMSTFTRALERNVRSPLYGSPTDSTSANFQKKAGETFLRNLHHWGISTDLIWGYGPIERQPTQSIPWPQYAGMNIAKSKHGIDPETYILSSLKFINCLCEFHFGERLLPNIKPTTPYTPVTWSELQAQDKANLIEGVDEQSWQQLWAMGALQCDIRT